MADTSSVLSVALGEVGYLEKKSNKDLDDKVLNYGMKNFTKYAKEYLKYTGLNLQSQPWCAMFVAYCFTVAYGLEQAKEMLCGFNAYTPTFANNFKKCGRLYYVNPQVGDVIFFKNATRICHVGIIYKIDSKYIYTIEGNTSNKKQLEANGGCVATKSYPLGYKNIACYGRPKYSSFSQTTQLSNGSDVIKKAQAYLNEFVGNNIEVDGHYGAQTKEAIVVALQSIIGATPTRLFDAQTIKKISVLKVGSQNELVKLAQCCLYILGYNPQNFNGIYTEQMAEEVLLFQKNNKLSKDKMFGKQCFTSILK